MELEVRSLDTATRRELSKKVDQYKKSLASLSEDHKRIKEKEEREGLFGDRDGIAVRNGFVNGSSGAQDPIVINVNADVVG